MRFLTLYSGSGGNSAYIEAAGVKILVDAGKSARTLCSSLKNIGVDIDTIDAIFITHEHSDHTSALETISKKHNIPIHMPCDCMQKFSNCCNELISHIFPHPPLFSLEIGGLKVSSFPTPHDSRMSVGYRFDFFEEGKMHSFGVATDMGYVTDEIKASLLGCEAVILESNHDVEMLKVGSYPYDLKKRILSNRGHLSNPDSAFFAAALAQSGTRHFLLAHLSEENNTPALALDEAISSIADPSVSVAVASPSLPTEIIFDK